MSAKFTSGPWKAVRNEVLCGRLRICSSVNAGQSLPLGEDIERAKHNAALIAAAPELYAAALEACHALSNLTPHALPVPVVLQQLRDAIAKAEGRS